MNRMVTGVYGHGTENDFVLIEDREDRLALNEEQVRRICDRKSGIGADGVIRIIQRSGQWFMDYRNADGSIAEMCGNGIRVMARYLVENDLQPSGIFAIDTRAGRKFLAVPSEGDISVNIGQVQLVSDEIVVGHNGHEWNGYHIDVGNPHAVVFLDDLSEVGTFSAAPVAAPDDEFPEGTNIEFVQFLPEGELAMRVFERGVGETRSCGTGTCAVALAATLHQGGRVPSRWVIHPPGGRLVVEIDPHNNATLTGPAVVIREVDLTPYLNGNS